MSDAEAELAGFVSEFAPELQELIASCRAAMSRRLPSAMQLVYDNYNFLVIGWGPTSKTSEAIFSLAADRNGVRLFFLQRGPEIPDPTGLLRGTGKVARRISLVSAHDLDRPEVTALLDGALALATVPMAEAAGPRLIIKSVSPNRRPRR